MQLTQKETSLLKDMKGQEKLCADKYTKYSTAAVDPQLKNLFSQLAAVELSHFESLSEIENGSVPSVVNGTSPEMKFTEKYGKAQSPEKQNDCYLCTDLLSTEKHVSSLYNTSIFEFGNEDLRRVLNHIQSEEQHHGKLIYDYMYANGMYS